MAISSKIQGFMNKGSWIRAMFTEGARRKQLYGPDNVFDFSLGNPDLHPPAEVLEELRRIGVEEPGSAHGYMPNAGFLETRAAIAEVLTEVCDGVPVRPEHLVMTVGAGGAMNVALHALLEPGEEVVVTSPYFVEYPFYVDNHGGRIVIVPTTADFDLDVDAIAGAITPRTKAVLLNSPNNPSGRVYPAATWARLGEMLRAKQSELGRDLYLINDEPYKGLMFDGQRFPSHFPHYANSIIATSFSKDLGLPGERIGYLALHPDLVDVDNTATAMVFCNRTLGFVNAPALWQRIARVAVRARVDIGEYQRRRDVLCAGLLEAGYELTPPGAGFYVWVKSPWADDVAFCKAAADHNLLLVPGSGFGTPGYVRLAFSNTGVQTIERALPAFAKVLRELGGAWSVMPPGT